MHSISEWWMWAVFFLLVFFILSIDMFLLGGKRAHRVSTYESLGWVITWLACALIFNLLLWWYLKTTQGAVIAQQKSLEFFTGYLIEESLSIDNLFIFILIFKYFSVPPEYQRRVLLYGLLGAMVMRLVMILLGVILVSQFHWILYIFGAFLIYTGIKMLILAEHEPDFTKNRVLKWAQKHLRITEKFHNENFIIRQNGLIYFTPLFLVLILIETSDLVFAIDSIPAIFAITSDPFIIFTSNIFAILGLRSLYFLLANVADRFNLLKYGIAIVLIFIGTKMILAYWFKIPIFIALLFVAIILLSSILLSLIQVKK